MGWEEIPIVYIDNFYKNPDMVRNLALRCHPPQTILEYCGKSPGTRVDMNMNLDHIHEVWKKLQIMYMD